MDKKRERNCIVVRLPSILVMVASSSLVCGVYGEGITNISQCMNTNLTPDVLAKFPTDSTSTAQNCVLAFVKGSVSGDLRTFASPFSDKVRISEFGFSSLDSIPSSASNDFSVLMSSISNCMSKITSYTEITNNGLIKASITLHMQGDNYNRNEVVHLDMSKANTAWHIIGWDVGE